MDPSTQIESQMLAEAKNAVLKSRGYVPADEIVGCAVDQLEQWKRDRLIFAIDCDGAELFPVYALDPQNSAKPYPAVAEILAIFDGELGNWGCAFWFEGVNGYLGGKVPRNVLATDPSRVIEAAALDIEPIAHA